MDGRNHFFVFLCLSLYEWFKLSYGLSSTYMFSFLEHSCEVPLKSDLGEGVQSVTSTDDTFLKGTKLEYFCEADYEAVEPGLTCDATSLGEAVTVPDNPTFCKSKFFLI